MAVMHSIFASDSTVTQLDTGWFAVSADWWEKLCKILPLPSDLTHQRETSIDLLETVSDEAVALMNSVSPMDCSAAYENADNRLQRSQAGHPIKLIPEQLFDFFLLRFGGGPKVMHVVSLRNNASLNLSFHSQHVSVRPPANYSWLAPKRITSVQLKFADGTCQILELVVHPEGVNLLTLLQRRISKASGVPVRRQRLLHGGRVVAVERDLRRLLTQPGLDAPVPLMVLVKTDEFSQCETHPAFAKDCFCPICAVMMCAKCGVRHFGEVGHNVADMTEEKTFFKVVEKHLEIKCTEEEAKLEACDTQCATLSSRREEPWRQYWSVTKKTIRGRAHSKPAGYGNESVRCFNDTVGTCNLDGPPEGSGSIVVCRSSLQFGVL
jgi:hypothetical protein